jgi:hypothetical protein
MRIRQTQQVVASRKRKWRQSSPVFAVHLPDIILIAIGATMNVRVSKNNKIKLISLPVYYTTRPGDGKGIQGSCSRTERFEEQPRRMRGIDMSL